MKKTILLSICLLLIAAVYAQNQLVLVKDSIFISNSGQPEPPRVTTTAYNPDCSKHSDTLFYTDFITSQLKIDGIVLYDYYSDGMLFHKTGQSISSDDSTFQNGARETYTYSATKAVATYLRETWFGTTWAPAEKTTNTYDAQGRITEVVYQNSNGLSPLQNFRRDLTEYDANGHITKTEYQNWNTTSNTWVPDEQFLSTYDVNGYLVTNVHHIWDTTVQTWTLRYSTTYYNNNKGQADSAITQTSDTTTYGKEYYTYDALTSLLFQDTYFSYLNNNNEIISGDRLTYFHDSANYVKRDSTLYENYENGGFPLENYEVLSYTSNPDHTLQSYIFTLYDVTSDTYSYYKEYYGYAPCSSALPVTLFNFSGEQKNNNTILHWQTTIETNASYFSIQRSTDAVNFTTIGKVKAAGNSSVLKDYTFTDANISLLNTQKLYYRLATTSNDGSIAYSKIIPVSIAAGRFIIAVSPNPFTDNINVNVPVVLQDAKVIISDVSGKIMYTATQHILSGKITIDASKFAKGVYILSIQSAGNKQVLKLVK
jgi:hypothetical protein